ncbi:unnamed protein product [Adineta ricciae]|nr:unnamed protein product [Adineta ricciae]
MTFNPSIIISDFEGSLRDIIKTEFPNSEDVRRYFHFTQAVYRNVQTLGLCRDYTAGEEIRELFVENVSDTFPDFVIELSTAKYDLLKPLFSYFDNQWIQKLNPQHWNVYEMKMGITNSAENLYFSLILILFSLFFIGYHNHLNLRIFKYYSNI